VKLREARLKHLGPAPFAKYADPVMIADEIEWCNGIFKENPRWRVLEGYRGSGCEHSECFLLWWKKPS